MKHFFLLYFFSIFLFPSLKAQDTIVLNDGKKILVKYAHIRQKIYYKTYVSPRKKDSLNKSDVNYVVHASGWKILMVPGPWYKPITITPGVGFSTMPYRFCSILGDSGSSIISYTPVLTLNIDYSPTSNFSLGIGIAWQSVKLHPYVSNNGSSSEYSFNPLFPSVNIHPGPNYYFITPNGTPLFVGSNSITENITRFNIGVRGLYHIRNDGEEDFYIGGRMGISSWTDQTDPEGYNSLNSLTAISIQAIIGITKYINQNFGINLEGGIGTPYFVNVGLLYKLDTAN